MINQYDIAYGLGVGISSPIWLAKTRTRRKFLRAFEQRMGHSQARDFSSPAVMIHAVSLGEINATAALVDLLRKQRPGLQFIVSVTTETGHARGRQLYGQAKDVTLVRYPLDFSSAIDRLMQALRPDVVALMELEVWPNFIKRCTDRKIPVLLINGRITTKSYRNYKMLKLVLGGMFRRLDQVCVQEEAYLDRFAEVGVPRGKLSVTGTMKFDNAQISDSVNGQEDLATAMGLVGESPIWVCGSTGPGEEIIVLGIYRQLLEKFKDLRLVIVPRKPERFDEVAELIEGEKFPILRRSKPSKTEGNPVILGDTMGELRKFYALASVVFVGRSIVDLGHSQHGSDMIEPAALGKPTIIGPFTGNFAEPVRRFMEKNAMVLVQDANELRAAVEKILDAPQSAADMGARAREVVENGQGATARHAEIILKTLDRARTGR